MHPLTRILAVIFLAVLVQIAPLPILALTGGLLLLANLHAGAGAMFRLLRRSRWLMLMLLVIYAFATPGEYVSYWPLAIAPTYEGIHDGVLQAVRLAIMLAGIAWLLVTTSRTALIAGIYLLMKPLAYVGLSSERFASRLWLTLHYVEQQQAKLHWRGWRSFDSVAGQSVEDDQVLTLEIQTLRLADWLACLSMLGVVLWWGL